jgi:hypothetical protein
VILRSSGLLMSSVLRHASTRPTSPGNTSPCCVTISTQAQLDVCSLTQPLMISFIIYSASSSLTLPPASSGVGTGRGGKQFGITRCLARPCCVPFKVLLGSEVVKEGGKNAKSLSGVIAPDVARDEAGVKMSWWKKNLAWLTASRCCARRMFSSTCIICVSDWRTWRGVQCVALEIGMQKFRFMLSSGYGVWCYSRWRLCEHGLLQLILVPVRLVY